MKDRSLPLAVLLSLVLMPLCQAQLPSLQEEPWFGHFIGTSARSCQFGFTAAGAGKIRVIGDRRKLLTATLGLSVTLQVEETLADGRVVVRRIRPQSLRSDDAPTLELTQVTITGEVANGSRFELTIAQDSTEFEFGARLLETPKGVGDQRLVMLVRVPSMYSRDKGKELESRKFVAKTRRDWIRLARLGEDRLEKVDPNANVDAAELTRGPLRTVQFRFAAHHDRTVFIDALGQSKLELTNREVIPLHRGFLVTWVPSAGSVESAKDRLRLKIR